MISQMKKVLLAGRLSDRETVLSRLRDAGVVHVEPVHPELVHAPAELLKDIAHTAKALEAVEDLKPVIQAAEFSLSPAVLVSQINAEMAELSRLAAAKLEVEKELERVAPWGAIAGTDLQALRENGLTVEFFTGPQGYEENLEAEAIQVVAKRDGVAYVVTASRKPIATPQRAARIPQPARDVVELEAALGCIAEEEKSRRERLSVFAGGRSVLSDYYRELLENRSLSEVETSLIQEGPIFVLQGWVPVAAVEPLKRAFGDGAPRVGIQIVDPIDEELPPTRLENPWWCRPIEVLYKVLGITPGYREVDISPLFLPFLTIFTAMLFADAGYGLVALAALALAYKPLTAKGVPRQLLNLFMVLFAGVLIYGVLTNAYFGAVLIKLTAFDPASSDGETILKRMCFLLGAIHISIAHIWKVRQNPIGLSSLAELGWVLFVWAMYALVNLLVLGDPEPSWMLPLFGVSLALVLFFTAPSWNVFLAVGKGLGAIALSAAAFLSDIISYIRLWAVGLAGGILAASFNELARPLPLLLAAVILIAAHLMNMALCLVAVFAHGVRLNLLEFSNHIGMEWCGREYDPFRKK